MKKNKKKLANVKQLKLDGWEVAGVVDVDAGLCWVGDPCYILHREGNDVPKDIGKTWHEFCDLIGEKEGRDREHEEWTKHIRKSADAWKELHGGFGNPFDVKKYEEYEKFRFDTFVPTEPRKEFAQFNHDAGHEGLGVTVQTGYGDGSYPVMVRYGDEGRIAELRVLFIEDIDEEDEEE